MTQYNRVNVELSTSQLNKLKSANNSSVDIKFSKTQLSKMIQSGGF